MRRAAKTAAQNLRALKLRATRDAHDLRVYLACSKVGLVRPESEVLIADGRKFRWDYAWFSKWPFTTVGIAESGSWAVEHRQPPLAAIEINGGTWVKGGHSTGRGIQRDYEKQNVATLAGWRWFTFTPQQIGSEAFLEALRWIKVQHG